MQENLIFLAFFLDFSCIYQKKIVPLHQNLKHNPILTTKNYKIMLNIQEIAMKLANIALTNLRNGKLQMNRVYTAKKSGFDFMFEIADGVFDKSKSRLFVDMVNFPLKDAQEWSVIMSDERQQYYRIANEANKILAAYEF